ncbi:MAG: glycosyltransferase family 4 protein, partial [Roseburia sp.]|nr:glycosyltransferase family 4 protein [Roseburia sp.]
MNIGILSQSKEKELTGINRMTVAILAELQKIDNSNTYYFLGRSDWLNIDFDIIKILMTNDGEIPLDYTIYSNQIDIVHSYYRPFRLNPNLHCGKILTIHDLRPLVHPEWGTRKDFNYFNESVRRCAERADIIMTVSEYTKRDIVEYYHIAEEKIQIIYPGLYPQTDMRKKIDGLENEQFFLSVAALDLNKNQGGLIKAYFAFRDLHPDHTFKLVLTGPVRNSEVVREILQQHPEYTDDIVYTGYVSEEELVWLYSKAEAFIYVSFYEGFGLPILEALSMGKAVICSNVTSMPEVGG